MPTPCSGKAKVDVFTLPLGDMEVEHIVMQRQIMEMYVHEEHAAVQRV